MAKPVYIHDTKGNVVILSTPDPTPSLTQIQSWLQTPLGVSAPNSILSTNSDNKLNKLIVDKIERADLDGGAF
jgi:hypothetical protein